MLGNMQSFTSLAFMQFLCHQSTFLPAFVADGQLQKNEIKKKNLIVLNFCNNSTTL